LTDGQSEKRIDDARRDSTARRPALHAPDLAGARLPEIARRCRLLEQVSAEQKERDGRYRSNAAEALAIGELVGRHDQHRELGDDSILHEVLPL